MDVLSKSIIFVGGKGGVGKSTSAAAIAWKSAEDGNKTLLISTDPAHNVGDIFNQKIGGKTKAIADNLYALEIDPEIETDNYIKTVKANIKGTVHSSMMEEVNRQLDTAKASPGADEAALFDKLIHIILEERQNFDKLVFDTAPTGHTIRLLTLPELMGVWIEGLLEKRRKTNENYTQLLNDGEPREDPIYDVLRERQERFSKARDLLLDEQVTGFIFVLNPERLPILETKKALDLLHNYHLHVKTLIINKILPEEADGEFLLERKKHEKKYLQLIAETFPKQKLVRVPLFSQDIVNKTQLELFSEYFKEG
ncbi:ArsA family ATPase [Microbacterium sp. APC 3898]|uniref:ArsA family ATPase n=2 Tax=Planococcus TaxID=1372 RepID=A0ABT7ZLZ8_9BACL|nr:MULTISPECIES: ArsA family ATPase [Terrabacteria group]MBD8015214.1 ArsA family ATPase [Planococcus wigleyi]MDN3428102.1 ArsA family ATPase [Planococcus sp. APC 4016]MDN3438954.1 ArsA family ATPase [Planococcus sp. APC 3900]MDN3498363.1 ArsA family ATPase [Microbacterium sp. APC 3898]